MTTPTPTLPTRLHTAAQVRALDRHAIDDLGIPGYELMTRAGQAAFGFARREWPGVPRMVVVCGAGNNAGDGYVVARLARAAGLEVEVRALVDPERLGGDAERAWHDYRDAGGIVGGWSADLPGDALFVDALLGTGLDRPLEGAFAEAVDAINAAPGPVMAIDIPTGLHADTGSILGTAVRAHATATFVGLKVGLFTGQGPAMAGRVVFDDLGIPPEEQTAVPVRAARLTRADVRRLLTPRPRDAHKGMNGRVLVVGGGPGMPGAARMAGEAALRAGAGLVTVATWPGSVAAIVSGRPELMATGVESAADLDPLLAACDVVALGPGLGRGDWAQAVFGAARSAGRPMVVDADGLNLLSEEPDTQDQRVITPHPGEAARLLGTDVATVQSDRLGAVAELRSRYGGVAVLKGAGTLVEDDGGTALCDRGNPGMATAGMGDVLTGVIAGIAAQLAGSGGDLAGAARCGVYVHAAAGDSAAAGGERGLLAGDLMPALRHEVNPR